MAAPQPVVPRMGGLRRPQPRPLAHMGTIGPGLATALVAIAAWYLADDWIAAVGLLVLAAGWRYLQTDDGPPVLALAFTFQWAQVTSGIYYYALTGRKLDTMVLSDYRPMVLIGLGSLVAILLGLKAGLWLARPRGAAPSPARTDGIDPKHAQLMAAFIRATQAGDLAGLTQLLARDVRVVTDGGGTVRAALNAIEGAEHVAEFLVDVTRERAGAWWRDDFTLRFATINGMPGVIVDAPQGPVQTTAFEIDGDVIRALYVVRNVSKLRHLARGA